jgi:hypothetical protein
MAQVPPVVTVRYDASLSDTFFTRERLAYPWYVMVRPDGSATVFPNDDSIVDLDQPEYRKRPVTGKRVLTSVADGNRYSDTSWTVFDKASLYNDTLELQFMIQQPPYMDYVYFYLHKKRLGHRFEYAPSIIPPDDPEYDFEPYKVVLLEITLNRKKYRKGDMLFAKIRMEVMNSAQSTAHEPRIYQGWIRCKVE